MGSVSLARVKDRDLEYKRRTAGVQQTEGYGLRGFWALTFFFSRPWYKWNKQQASLWLLGQWCRSLSRPCSTSLPCLGDFHLHAQSTEFSFLSKSKPGCPCSSQGRQGWKPLSRRQVTSYKAIKMVEHSEFTDENRMGSRIHKASILASMLISGTREHGASWLVSYISKKFPM